MAESGLWSQTFGYDQYGNMSGTSTGLTGLPALPGSGSYNTSTNQLTAGGVWFDSNGNQKVVGSSTLSYDGESRQSIDYDSVTGNTITYSYDGLGQRVSKTVVGGFGPTTYVHDALGNLAAEYTYSMGTPSCSTCYLSWDHLGSTRMVTDQSGAVIANGRHDFLPFGVEIPGGTAGRTSGVWGGTDYLTAKFTGQERDSESGLDFFKTRYYAGGQGRFMRPDQPLLDQDPSDPQSWNLYGYGRNNPLKYTDPSGQSVTICAPGCTVFGISDDDYQNIQSQPWYMQGGLNYPSINQLQASGGFGWITDSTGDSVGSVRWTCDNPGICGAANQAGAAHIAGSQSLINEFIWSAASTAAGGLAGEVIGGIAGGYISASRLGMLKPLVSNPKLAAIVDELFQVTDKVPGGTAGAVRFEQESGIMLSPKGHAQDAQDIIGYLNNLLKDKNGSGWSLNDQAVAKKLIRDLQNALRGK